MRSQPQGLAMCKQRTKFPPSSPKNIIVKYPLSCNEYCFCLCPITHICYIILLCTNSFQHHNTLATINPHCHTTSLMHQSITNNTNTPTQPSPLSQYFISSCIYPSIEMLASLTALIARSTTVSHSNASLARMQLTLFCILFLNCSVSNKARYSHVPPTAHLSSLQITDFFCHQWIGISNPQVVLGS